MTLLNREASRTKEFLAEGVLVAVAIMWGVNPPVIKLGLQHIPPQPYNVARLITASLMALAALAVTRSWRRMPWADVVELFRVSLFGFFVFQFFFTEGIQRTTSGNASFILCLMPLSVLLINKITGLETISRSVVKGLACSVLGIALIVAGAGKGNSAADTHMLGSFYLLLSQAGYAYYTVFSKELRSRYSTLQITAYLMAMTTILVFIASMSETIRMDWSDVPYVAWFSVLFSGILALFVCNFLWIWGNGVIGTSRAAIFNNLSPVFTLITAYFLLNEAFGSSQYVGAVLVLVGVNLTRKRQEILVAR